MVLHVLYFFLICYYPKDPSPPPMETPDPPMETWHPEILASPKRWSTWHPMHDIPFGFLGYYIYISFLIILLDLRCVPKEKGPKITGRNFPVLPFCLEKTIGRSRNQTLMMLCVCALYISTMFMWWTTCAMATAESGEKIGKSKISIFHVAGARRQWKETDWDVHAFNEISWNISTLIVFAAFEAAMAQWHLIEFHDPCMVATSLI